MAQIPRCPTCRITAEWDKLLPDRAYCPRCDTVFDPASQPEAPVGERLAYKDGD